MNHDLMTTEEKIIASAVEIFAQKGYNGTTTKEIARMAGVAEGTIFRYFPKKKDILHSILLKTIEILGPKIIGNGLAEIFQDQQHKSDRDILQMFIKNRMDTIYKHLPLIKVVLNEAQYHPDLATVYFKKVVPPVKEAIDDFFRRGMEEGRFKKFDPSVGTMVLVGGIFSHVMFIKNGILGNDGDHDGIIEQIVELLLRGILKDGMEE